LFCSLEALSAQSYHAQIDQRQMCKGLAGVHLEISILEAALLW